jgi:uncharacterized membrane protein SpoIIM required for sporulation
VNEASFVRERAARWTELRNLLARAQRRGLSALSGSEARRLGSLYRLATTDLALARSLRLPEPTVVHVNRLCAAAHDLVYAGHRRAGAMSRFGRFLAQGFPSLVRRTSRFHAAVALTFLAASLAGYLVFRDDPELAERSLGTVFQERAERARAAGPGAQRYLDLSAVYMPFMSWGIIANNVGVTLMAFALGAFLGVGSLVPVVATGVGLGGGFAVFEGEGVSHVLWTWVAAHGPLELTAVFIAAGAGMRLGFALVVPGRRSRAAAFRDTGRESVLLLGGTAVMLVVAGLLEGFVSPSDLPAPTKWAIGAGTAAFAAWYFLRCQPVGPSPSESGVNGRPAAK